MATATEQIDAGEVIGTDPANDSVLNDLGPIDGDGLGTTPSTANDYDSEAIAQKPEIQDAFSKVFGGKPATAQQTRETTEAKTTHRQQRHDEEIEELAGMEGLDELDDGAEPPSQDEPKQKLSQKVQDVIDGERKEEETEADEKSTTLSPILMQAAKRAGWNESEIEELNKANPELAEKTFQKFLKSFNDISAQFSMLGSQYPQQQNMPQQQQNAYQQPQQQPYHQQQQNQQQDSVLKEFYSDQALEAIKERLGGDDDLVEMIVKPLVAPIREVQQESQKRAFEAVAREVNGFFGGIGNEFVELYGKGENVSKDQDEARSKLANLADRIRLGARVQGLNLSVSECLERANLMFASEHLGMLERKKITRQVQNRSKNITHRPTQRRSPSAQQGGQPSIQGAMDAYSRRAAELGYEL